VPWCYYVDDTSYCGKKAPGETNCAAGRRVDTLLECNDAANQLMNDYWKTNGGGSPGSYDAANDQFLHESAYLYSPPGDPLWDGGTGTWMTGCFTRTDKVAGDDTRKAVYYSERATANANFIAESCREVCKRVCDPSPPPPSPPPPTLPPPTDPPPPPMRPPHTDVQFEGGDTQASECPDNDYAAPYEDFAACFAAAQSLGLTTTSANTIDDSNYPRGCIFLPVTTGSTSGMLFFNEAATGAPAHETGTVLLCRAWAAPPPPTNPPPGEPPVPSPPPPGGNVARRGLILGEDVTATCLEHFADAVSWAYDYSHRVVSLEHRNFCNAHGVEWVPMVHAFFVDTQLVPGGASTRCFLTAASANTEPQCNGATELTAQLGRVIANYDGKPVRYLMTMNEPFVVAARIAHACAHRL